MDSPLGPDPGLMSVVKARRGKGRNMYRRVDETVPWISPGPAGPGKLKASQQCYVCSEAMPIGWSAVFFTAPTAMEALDVRQPARVTGQATTPVSSRNRSSSNSRACLKASWITVGGQQLSRAVATRVASESP